MSRYNLIILLSWLLVACSHIMTPASTTAPVSETPAPAVRVAQVTAAPTPTYWLVSADIDRVIDSRGQRIPAAEAGLQPGEYWGQITLLTSDKVLDCGRLRFYLIVVTQVNTLTGVVSATLAIPASDLAQERDEVADALQAHALPVHGVLLGDPLIAELFVTIDVK